MLAPNVEAQIQFKQFYCSVSFPRTQFCGILPDGKMVS